MMTKAKKKVTKAATTKTTGRSVAEQLEGKGFPVKLMMKEEPLLPRLTKYLDRSSTPLGPMLRHPLLVTFVDPQHAAWVNQAVHDREKRLAELRAKGDWKAVMGGYAVPFLVEGFYTELANFDDATYWEVLAYVWVMQEQLWPNRGLLLQLFQSPRSQRDKLMNKSEHLALGKLPDTFPIYRGFIGRRGKGLSWTTEKKKAIWFAERFAILTHLGQPKLVSGEARKADVLAFFSRRKESEVVIDPAKVKRQTVVQV